MVNLAASLREPGAVIADVEVLNLSTDGFMARCELKLESGQSMFLKLPGMVAQKCRVVWIDEDKAGFEFTSPMHRGLIDELTTGGRRPTPRGHFGPRRG